MITEHPPDTDDSPIVVSGSADLSSARRSARARAERSLGSGRADDVALAVSELLTNSLEHGTGDDVVLHMATVDDDFEVVVDSSASGPPRAGTSPSPDAVRGRGLLIVAELADAVDTTFDDGRLRVTCRFRRR